MADFNEDDLDFSAISKIKGGMSINELISAGEKEFVLDAEDPDLEVECETERRIDTLYPFEEYQKLINLDCIKCDPDDTNSTDTPFDVIRRSMENVTADGKVMKQIMNSGTTKIPEKGVVYLHYNSCFEMEEVPFDSSNLRHEEPLRLQMGDNRHYPGFEIAVLSMRVGEKSRFLIHPDLAFGKLGVPPRIPPDAHILLTVEVFKAVDCGMAKQEESMSMEQRKSFQHIYKVAKGLHARGNDYYSLKNVAGAVDNYLKAENLLIKCSLSSDEEEEKFKHLLLKVYTNLAVCYNNSRMKMPERVCIFVRKAFETDAKRASQSAKLLHNRGLAHFALCNYSLAINDFKKAQRLEPNNTEINEAIAMVERKKKQDAEVEKEMCTKALGFSSLKIRNPPPTQAVDDECKAKATQILEDFTRGNLASLQLSYGFTYNEKCWLKSECQRLGLTFEESNAFMGHKEIIIKKF